MISPGCREPPLLSVKVLVADRLTVEVTVLPVASPGIAGVSFESMLYVPFVIRVPFGSGLFTRTTSCTRPDPPAARVPRFQVTTPAARAPPEVAETNVVFAGRVSRTRTPVASAVPVLTYDRV